MGNPFLRLASAVPIVLTVSVLLLIGVAGCTDDPSTFGQFRKGRTLHFSVVSLERTPELRYTTCDVLVGSNPPVCDPEGVRRNWSIAASGPGTELVLVRARVENHTAVSAFVNVDENAAELRDIANAVYFPLPVGESAWRDFRGQPEALVRVEEGQCFDGSRVLIDPGTSVKWQSESDEVQYLDFEQSVPVDAAELVPGGSVSYPLDQPGTYSYKCGDAESVDYSAEVRVAGGEESDDFIERTTTFLFGSFELQKGHGIDGFLIFEAPVDRVFRDMRWKAADSITFGF